MQWKKKFVMAALSVSLTAVVSPAIFTSEALCAPREAIPVDCPVRAEDVFYQNSGMRFFVPKELDGLLLTETPRKGEHGPGRLFSVSERASIAAAKASGHEVDGAGWLFDIGWVDEQHFHEILCGDMSGAEIFARDSEGNRFVFYHPTDVRYMRENNEAMKRDMPQWERLNQWAWQSVRGDFILDNLCDNLGNVLTPETYDNSSVAMALARIAYRPGTKCTISTTQYGSLAPSKEKAAPFVEQLIRNASYEIVDLKEAPDGEYVVLDFPEDNIRFDFFQMSGKENYVREVRADGGETFYKASFADGITKASDVMQRWYWAIAERRGK